MSTLERMIDLADDRWPAGGELPDDALGQVLLASHLLGADRAVANFGGGNTSAKGKAVDHLGREVDAIWVKGSGSDLATMERADFTPLRLDEVLPLFGRDEMSDEEMVAHLARCQLDPAAPRSSIETLLHAFVPAAHVHHTHPDAINVLAGTRDGERLVAECFGDEAAWIPYIRPGFALAKQVGTAVRENPASSSSCWPSTGSWCGATRPKRPTAARSRSSTGRSTSSTRGPRARRGSAAR